MTHWLESVMLPTDLPGDLPSFLERFGTDQQCRAYLFAARWPEGFCCAACGHGRAWALKERLIYECAACGKQHSLLAGTIFDQAGPGREQQHAEADGAGSERRPDNGQVGSLPSLSRTTGRGRRGAARSLVFGI